MPHQKLYIFLIIEVIFLSLISIAVVLLYFFMEINRKKREKLHKELRSTIFKYIVTDETTPPKIQLKFRKLHILIPILEEFDLQIAEKKWFDYRNFIIETFIYPTAIRYAKSKSWEKRSWAVKTFTMYFEKNAELIINELLSDKVLLIRLQAIPAAMKMATPLLIRTMIEIMSKGSRFSNYAYKDALMNANAEVTSIIVDFLKTEKDVDFRAACLELLSSRTIPDLINNLDYDLTSTSKNLRIQATKVLANYPSSFSLFWLKRLLMDDDWQIRAIAAKSIGKLHDESTIPILIKALSDREWWVRLNSAYSLLEFGKRGEDILKSIDRDVDKYAYDIARYVLETKEIEV